MSGIDDRSELLLGPEGLALLKKGTVAVFGLGGVGGTCFEALVRTGVGHIHAIDADVVEASNLNRQILYAEGDIGAKKALVAFLRAKSIRGDVEVLPECYRVSAATLAGKDYGACACLIDAVDEVGAKLALIEYARARKIPLFVSLGMGNRLDPSQVAFRSLADTEGDPLAKRLRNELRKKGIPLGEVMCVASAETPAKRGRTPASLMTVPSAAGLLLAYKAIETLLKPMGLKNLAAAKP